MGLTASAQKRILTYEMSSPRKLHRSFYIDETHEKALKFYRAEDGILPSEQVRRALTGYFSAKAKKHRRETVGVGAGRSPELTEPI